jgi:small multidrug resistance family-3 protein
MQKFINKSLNSVKNYTIWDFACLKVTLVFSGILLGSYFSKFFLSKIFLVWIIFIITYIYILLKTFKSN